MFGGPFRPTVSTSTASAALPPPPAPGSALPATAPISLPSQSAINGILAAIGAAGGVGAFILLIRPAARKEAVIAALVVLLIGLGVVSYLESLYSSPPNT